ncbi:MAG: DUF2807 domain-containing protein [Prevotellaceae bacterium]|nr:DUF2807 domain-containing protein [Prevotellaceae bacterium]
MITVKKILMAAMTCTVFFSTAECLAGTAVREERKTEPFSGISVRRNISVYYTQKDVYSVVVEACEDHIGEIITETEDGTLTVKWKNSTKNVFRKTSIKDLFKKNMSRKNRVTVYVSSPKLDRASVSSGSDFLTDTLKCDNSFHLSVSSSADARIGNLTVTGDVKISTSSGADARIGKLSVPGNFKISTSSSADLNIGELSVSGNVKISSSSGADSDINILTVTGAVDISTSSSADCHIRQMQASGCNIDAKSGSNVKIDLDLSGTLNASASSSADIVLKGTANDISAAASSGADINIRKMSYKNVKIYSSSAGSVYR